MNEPPPPRFFARALQETTGSPATLVDVNSDSVQGEQIMEVTANNCVYIRCTCVHVGPGICSILQ